MHPKYKIAVFLAIIVALMAPYSLFALYCYSKYPGGSYPDPINYANAILFTANLLVPALVFKKFAVKDLLGDITVDPAKMQRISKRAKKRNLRLLIVLSSLFLYGAVLTIQGKVP